MEMAQYSDAVRVEVKEEDECRRVLIKEELNLDMLYKVGYSYSDERCEWPSAEMVQVEMKDDVSSPGIRRTHKGVSSHQGHPHKAWSASSSGEKVFNCLECGKGFSFPSDLKRHAWIHTGDKPFHCLECGKSFGQSGALKSHTMIHTGDKPFHCLECGKSFRQAGTLRKHAWIHSEDKPFHCLQCGKGFNTSNYLKLHTKSHTRVRFSTVWNMV